MGAQTKGREGTNALVAGVSIVNERRDGSGYWSVRASAVRDGRQEPRHWGLLRRPLSEALREACDWRHATVRTGFVSSEEMYTACIKAVRSETLAQLRAAGVDVSAVLNDRSTDGEQNEVEAAKNFPKRQRRHSRRIRSRRKATGPSAKPDLDAHKRMLEADLYENGAMFRRWLEEAGARPERTGRVVRELLTHVAYIAVAHMELVARHSGSVTGSEAE